MDNIKFFRILWRFNAIIIAMASLALIVVSITILYESKTRMYSQSSSVYFHDSEQTDEIEEEWFFGKMTGFHKINNTFAIPLEFTQKFSQKTTASIRNYLFVDGHTQSSTWLFPHNHFVLSTPNYVLRNGVDEYPSYSSSNKIIALYFIVYKADTNKDKALKTNDEASIALVKPDGTGYTELEKNVGNIIKADVINDGSHLVLFFYKGKEFYVSKYSLDEFKKISEQRIETIGKKSDLYD